MRTSAFIASGTFFHNPDVGTSRSEGPDRDCSAPGITWRDETFPARCRGARM